MNGLVSWSQSLHQNSCLLVLADSFRKFKALGDKIRTHSSFLRDKVYCWCLNRKIVSLHWRMWALPSLICAVFDRWTLNAASHVEFGTVQTTPGHIQAKPSSKAEHSDTHTLLLLLPLCKSVGLFFQIHAMF